MATRHDPFDDNEPRAFEPGPDDESIVEAHNPFNAEVKKRRNTRALVAGGMVLVLLIAGLVVAGIVLKNMRERWSSEQAEKEKTNKDKMATNRRPREFQLVPKAETERPAIPARAAASMPAAAPIPLAQTPPPAFPPTASAAPAPRPPPPPMMLAPGQGGGTLDGPGLAAGLTGLPGPGTETAKPDTRQTVQAQASKDMAKKPATASTQALAAALGDRSFVLARGSWIPCILETQLDTTVPGNTSCVIPEDVYSDDGKALLIERGSKALGVFNDSLKRGDKRIAVQWARVKTARGIVIDVDSPATDGVGTSGAGGYVDNHWMERIGAALLVSFVDDAVKFALTAEQNKRQNTEGSSTTVFIPQNSAGGTTKLAEKILDSTINIPPTLYKNRGDRVMIFVNRDLWFDSTYRLVKDF